MAVHVGIVLAIVLLECGTSSPSSSLSSARNARGATAAAPTPSEWTLARRINTLPGPLRDISGIALFSGAWVGWKLADGRRGGGDGDECRGKRGLLAGDVRGVGGEAKIARQRWPGGVGRLRGGGQGEQLDEKRKDMEWTRIMMRVSTRRDCPEERGDLICGDPTGMCDTKSAAFRAMQEREAPTNVGDGRQSL